MHKILLILIGTSFFAPTFAQDCEKGASTAGQVYACEASKVEAKKRLLNREYNSLLGAIKAQKDADTDYVNEQMSLIDNAQRAWITYRDASCAFIGSGGSVNRPAEIACLDEFIQARIKVLQRYKQGL